MASIPGTSLLSDLLVGGIRSCRSIKGRGKGRKGKWGKWTCVHGTGEENGASSRNSEGRGHKVYNTKPEKYASSRGLQFIALATYDSSAITRSLFVLGLTKPISTHENGLLFLAMVANLLSLFKLCSIGGIGQCDTIYGFHDGAPAGATTAHFPPGHCRAVAMIDRVLHKLKFKVTTKWVGRPALRYCASWKPCVVTQPDTDRICPIPAACDGAFKRLDTHTFAKFFHSHWELWMCEQVAM